MLKDLIIIRGGGDLASGTIYKLYQAGFPLIVLEIENPSAIRRNVAFSEAIYNGSHTIEGVTATLVKTIDEATACIKDGGLPIMVDPKGAAIDALKPAVVVDAILAKKNLGTNRKMAPEIETLFMMPSENLAYVTASTVREIMRYNGDVSSMVTPAVLARMKKGAGEQSGN
jgi:hypothetical protein